MTHILDRPVWSALQTVHAHLGEGDERARRFMPDVSPFAATCDDSPENLAALGRLVADGKPLLMLTAGRVHLPPGMTPDRTAEGVQMVSEAEIEPMPDPRITPLGAGDIAEMLALARLTNPGPFTLRARELGGFWGIRQGGRLVAMAGERLKQPGYVELSGVCVHPDARGQGLARQLSLHVSKQIRQGGNTPYLHAFATNIAAIRLYESIGFRLRSAMDVAMIDARS